MAGPLHDVDIPIKKATLAMGCFWGCDALYGALRGVIRTRVGYCGGTTDNPTYKKIGDHTESIEIDYDPKEVSFKELLDSFWNNHDPTAKNTKQYTSLIFYHDEEQKSIAEKSLMEVQANVKGKIQTQIIPASRFYDAEDYHQKYRLQNCTGLVKAINLKQDQLKSSHIAARLNGYVVGFGGVAQFDEEWSRLGIDKETAEKVRQLVIKYEGCGITC